MSTREFTRWVVLASGEGGGRIASNYFIRTENPGIDDRILMMNTNRADMGNVARRMGSISTRVDEDEIANEYTLQFGSLDGVGNYFPGGEACAREDMDRIVDRIQDEGFDAADAFLYISTLGGGTGNGSVPFLIRDLNQNAPSNALETTTHVALATWPYDHEGGQRHFNAVCGLSRLLRWYDNSQNADLVLLVANSHIEESLEADAQDEDEYQAVNERIITALDLMIGAGRETQGIVDVNDWVIWPSQLDAYHFTPGLATDMSDAFELEFIFDQAAENTFVPMDPTTTSVVYAVVRAPKHLVDQGEYSEAKLERRLDDWTDEAGMDGVVHQMVSLTPVERTDDSIDVLLLFGGFDLDPLLEGSRPSFDAIMERATESGLQSNVDMSNHDFTTDQFRKIRNNLDDYLSQNGG